MNLSWTPPTSGAAASSYVIEAGTTPDALLPLAAGPALSLAVSSVPSGTYYVRVRGASAAGAGAATPAVTVVVP